MNCVPEKRGQMPHDQSFRKLQALGVMIAQSLATFHLQQGQGQQGAERGRDSKGNDGYRLLPHRRECLIPNGMICGESQMEWSGVNEATFLRASSEEGAELTVRPSWARWHFLNRIFTAFCFVLKVLLLGLWNHLTPPQRGSREVGWVSCRAHLIHEKKKYPGR